MARASTFRDAIGKRAGKLQRVGEGRVSVRSWQGISEIRSVSILPFIYLFIERTLEIPNLSRLDEEIPCINILRNVIDFNDP